MPEPPQSSVPHHDTDTPQTREKAQAEDSFVPSTVEYKINDLGEMVSHDPVLNQDGDALYRFILTHARADGTTKDIEHSEKETVTDFDFVIGISQHISVGPYHWSVPDAQAAYRGKLQLEVDRAQHGHDPERGQVNTKRELASDEEIAAVNQQAAYQKEHGLPPWATVAAGVDLTLPYSTTAMLQSPRSLREWTDEYCRSDKVLKKFKYEKRVYGWDTDQLEAAVRDIILETGYSGSHVVTFITWRNVIVVYPDNYLARVLDYKWVKIALWVLLIYPFIWLFKNYHESGGGKWQVCGGAYAIKYWDTNTAAPPDPEASDGDQSAEGIVQTPRGPARVVGLKEGEWFKRWERTIRLRVKSRFQSEQLLTTPDADVAGQLDGY
ncbi:hypothetical protein ONZ51_g12713 [Trametes cubensis]|uniref:Uncharacterized protein n=1 Tax=Trametes cubensis TaxID=1111947 RepID=A0AAD7TGP5_9APHY|nr:hypothetical protein ONZ51_g12713 [Trametes cubensis]